MEGIGIDVVQTERIGRMLQRHGLRFVRQILSEREQELISSWLPELDAIEPIDLTNNPPKPKKGFSEPKKLPHRLVTFMAGRWCAKEAVMKVLEAGLGALDVRHIEIMRTESGSTRVELSGTALAIAESKGISRWQLSISHEKVVTVAVAVGL